jgi:hypothetical protein
VVHTDRDGTRWRRVGECNHCGACCMGDDPSILNPLFTDTDRAGRTVAGHCPLLRLTDGRSSCTGHAEHPFYLGGCHTFPTRPEDIATYPSCSYRFEAVA